MTRYAHYTARARLGLHPFADEIVARSTWRRLRIHFPETLAAILMPNHLHLVTADRGEEGVVTIGRILGASARSVGRRSGRGSWWQRVPPPQPLSSRDKVMRMVRDVWLNPCRPWRHRGRKIRLLDDPLGWPWSTLHDTLGAVVDPWVPTERVAQAFGWTGDDLAERLHRYAMRDDGVAAEAFPSRPPPSDLPDRRFDEIPAAALAATRRPHEDLQRRTPARGLAVSLAYRQGWRLPSKLAPRFGMNPRSLSRLAKSVPADHLEAAALCLDPRLRRQPMDAILAAAERRGSRV